MQKKFTQFAAWATKATGTSGAFILAFLIVFIWGLCGPIFGFSQAWQIVINTGTTIITFLMIFLIQHSQNKDTAAIHLKLDEILSAHDVTNNALIDIEDLTEEELDELKEHYKQIKQKNT